MEANDMKAMREALEAFVAYWDWNGYDAMRESRLKDMARAALAKPPRNCDVGTPEEQAQRFGKLCGKYYNEEESCNEKCPLASLPIIHGFPRCQAYWAQMPYKAQEGGAE